MESSKSLWQQVPCNGKAQQKDKFPEVVMKMPKDGTCVAKVPNGETLTVLEVDGHGPDSQGRVKWKETEGWVKMCNVIPCERQPAPGSDPGPDPAPSPYPASQFPYKVKAQQKENYPEVVLKMPKNATIVAKVPNGEIMTVFEVDGHEPDSQGRVKWKETEGWVKMCNVIPVIVPPVPVPVRVPAPLPPGEKDVFVCGQITPALRTKLTDLRPQSLKSSMPDFNKPRDEGGYPEGMQNYDIPCYGPILTQAVDELLNTETVKKQAEAMRFMQPRRNINEVIQNKVQERGPQLIEEIKRAGGDEAAIRKLEGFVNKAANLGPKDFVADGKPRSDGCWHDGTVNEGWQKNLHVDTILTNFGFTDTFCQSFKERKYGRDSTWSAYAVRWLSKAFDVFSFAGSLSDVVNLIYAMLGKPNGKPDINEVVNTVKEFTTIIERKEFGKLVWKPNYLIQDSELDDMMVWLLLCAIHPTTGPTFVCDVQLPTEEAEKTAVQAAKGKTARERLVPNQIAYLKSQYESRSTEKHRVITFQDPQSRNVDKVQVTACYVPPRSVYLVSATEMRSFCGKYDWAHDKSSFVCTHEFGNSCLYLHPVTGYWVICLDEKTKGKDFYQIQAMKKGCIPNSELGWRLLVRPENNPENAKLKSQEKPLQWEEYNKVGIRATWLELNHDGLPIRPDGTVKEVPADEKPVFSFHITTNPTEHPESPPLCTKCKAVVAEFDGFTRCGQHKWQLPPERGFTKRTLACPIYKEAKQFLDELGVEQWIDHAQDHCWCPNCNEQAFTKAPTFGEIQEGGEDRGPYVTPKGWVAFGVVISRHSGTGVEFDDLKRWPNTFHGTSAENLSKMLQHGQIGMPGDRLVDDDVLMSTKCAGRQDFGKFYTSPTVAYAGLQLYARPRKSKTSNVVGQVVLQCNQEKTGYKVGDIVDLCTDGDRTWEVGKIVRIAEDGTVRVEYGVSQNKDVPRSQCNGRTIRKAWKYFVVHNDGVPVTADHTLASGGKGRLSKGDEVMIFSQHVAWVHGQPGQGSIQRSKILEPAGWITTWIQKDPNEIVVKDIRDPLYFEQGETMGFGGGKFPVHGVCKYIPLYNTPPCSANCQLFQDTLHKRHITGSADTIEIVSGMPERCVIRRILVRTFKLDSPPTKTSLENRQLKPLPGENEYETFRSPVDGKANLRDKAPGESGWL